MRRISPRQLRRMQAKMLGNLGLDLKELGKAEEVRIRLPDREIVLEGSSVFEMKFEGERIYQIVGGEEVVGEAEREEAYEPTDEDVMLVAAQTGVSEDEARNALRETGGDLAKAILLLKSKR
ncbi:MAG TPA: hypothetical protein ENG52_02620 [Nitrososphaeria archaeon]|nr:hypothetical protein [Nitrososphaeria archaeon]